MFGIAQYDARKAVRRALRAARRARKQARMEAAAADQWQPAKDEVVWIRRFIDGEEIVSVGKVIAANHIEWDANGNATEGVLVNAVWGRQWSDREGCFVPRIVKMLIPRNDVAAHTAGAVYAA